MPKTKKVKGDKISRPGSLAHQIVAGDAVKSTGRKKARIVLREDVEDEFVESDLSKKILTQARGQQKELMEEHGFPAKESKKSSSLKEDWPSLGSASTSTLNYDDDDDESKQLSKRLSEQEGMLGLENIEPEEEKAFELFMRKGPTLSSLQEEIKSRLTDKKTEIETVMSDGNKGPAQLHPELVEMFRKVGDVLKRYRSGKLPKIFKALPAFEDWEPYLAATKPEEWSAAAMYAATKLFASNLSAPLAQRFYNLILLPRIRDDIQEYKRLNFHLMMALKKSLFKTSAFFKGILLPLCESGDCTLREALIIASVVREHSIPAKHGGAAIDCLTSMQYSGATSIFLRTLLDKKYALAYSVINSLVKHFYKFLNDKRVLPVLWHQSLLIFIQRYKNDLTKEQQDLILELVAKHSHHEISPEIKRELENSHPASSLMFT